MAMSSNKQKILLFYFSTAILILGVTQPVLATKSTTGTGLTAHSVTPIQVSKTINTANHTIATQVPIKNTCPCIVFRLDGIKGSYLYNVQTKIMDEFQKKNAGLTLGIVGYNLHTDTKLVSYIKNSLKSGHGNIEIANHGWTDEKYDSKNIWQQVLLINKTNQELLKTLGKKPNTFTVPYGMYDDNTAKALKQLKMNVISSDIWSEDKFVTTNGKLVTNKDPSGIYHIPSMTGFQADMGNGTYWTSIPKDKLIASINNHILRYGYDVIELHPQNFAMLVNGNYADAVDKTALDELAGIIDYAKSKHITMITLSDIAGFDKLNVKPVVSTQEKSTPTKPISIKSTQSKLAPINSDTIFEKTSSTSKPHKTIQPARSVVTVEPNGTLTVDMKYESGDRIGAGSVSLKIYHDFDRVPYKELKSISDNPYTIESLPLYHKYKVETYMGGMLVSTNLATLDTSDQNMDVLIPYGGYLHVGVYYNDGQTPIPGASVSVKSQDNKTMVSGIIESDGSALQFSLPPTLVYGNYYVVDTKINSHLAFSSAPVILHPRDENEVRLVTPWPSIVQSLVTVKVYNQTSILSSAKQKFAVDLYDNTGKRISESPVSIHGEADFWSMKIGDYIFKVVSIDDGKILQTMNVTIDGINNNFSMMLPNIVPSKEVANKI